MAKKTSKVLSGSTKAVFPKSTTIDKLPNAFGRYFEQKIDLTPLLLAVRPGSRSRYCAVAQTGLFSKQCTWLSSLLCFSLVIKNSLWWRFY